MSQKRTIVAFVTVGAAISRPCGTSRNYAKIRCEFVSFIEFTLDIKLSWVHSVGATDSRPHAKYQQ